MRKLILTLFSLLLVPPGVALGQIGNVTLKHFPGAPSGTCGRNQVAVNDSSGAFFSCNVTTAAWTAAGGGLPTGCTSPANGQIQCSLFSTTGGSTAGTIGLTQGTAPSTTAGAVQIVAPASVTAYNMLLPGAASTGFLSCSASGATDTCSFAASAVSNYFTNTTGTGIGPTSFTPATANTLDILDSTATTGNTQLWLGYDGGGSFTGQHISAVRTNLGLVRGTGQGAVLGTDDFISFYTSNGTYRGGIIFGSGNNLQLGAPAASALALGAGGGQNTIIASSGQMTNNFGIGVTETSTAAIASPQPVKADTANANQVVVTTTTDTGAGIPLGVCMGNPGAAGICQVVTTGIVALTLGTGTCAIGNFVIVDTTTNGRVKCTATYTAGANIGVAMAAQAAVGSTFNVLLGLR